MKTIKLRKTEVRNVLEAIRRKHPERKLMAADVVKAAEKTNHYLHDYFEWDDAKAGPKYRLMQARKLIVRVKVVESEASPAKPVYVSLIHDRETAGGGYRKTDELRSAEDKAAIRQLAVSELVGWIGRWKGMFDVRSLFTEAELAAFGEQLAIAGH